MSAQHTAATRRIQDRLERMELQHLRALAKAQALRIERLQRAKDLHEQRALRWRNECYDEAQRADMFLDLNNQMQDSLQGQQIGMTMTGRLMLVPTVDRVMGAPRAEFVEVRVCRSASDPRTWRVDLEVGADWLLARFVVDDFGDLVRVTEWTA